MSLESALDEEMREVMAILEGKQAKERAAMGRTESPHPAARAQSPASAASPVRSMLDIGPAPLRSPTTTNYSSMLNPGSPQATRSSSRSSSTVVPLSPPPSARSVGSPSGNPVSAYQFDMLPTIEAHSMPKRVTQAGKLPKARAMSSVYGDPNELLGSAKGHDRQGSLGSFLGKKAISPRPGRSISPAGRVVNTNPMNLRSDPNKFVTDSGKVIDMSTAYRRLSDAALLRSGGKLSSLPTRKGSDPARGESLAPGGGIRLATDDFGEEHALETSEEYDSDASSEGERWTKGKRRGRRRTRPDDESEDDKDKPPRPQVKSLLAAAEEERKDVSSSYKVRSLLEPMISVTGPNGEKMPTKKTGVHPNTNFDQAGSGLSTPFSSDTEADLSDFQSAQQLAMDVTPIQSTPEAHRCVRQIIRGNYSQFQQDAEQGLRRQRVYLVATDISEEAAYALEWTIGTVLRDGDTLLAVYAVDEEIGVGGTEGGETIATGTTAQQESDHLTKTLSNSAGTPRDGTLSPVSNSVMATESDVKSMGKAEKARYQAAVEVSDRCVKLLRKTRLQVRVVVEVFHCKSPKHMLTEVIDFLEPTLVVLGSRGRNALKGVLLGSFSNYLVTKSSVPVMVARKRLRKHSKYKRKNLRLSNVLTNPSGKLANAKVD